MPVEIRKVGYSPSLGVLLGVYYGGVVWSRSGTFDKNVTAPTFLSYEELKEYLAIHLNDGTKWEQPDDFRLAEVWPSKGTEATSEDCGVAGLGYWHE